MNKELNYIKAVTLICFAFGVLGVGFALASDSSSMMFDGLYSLIQSIFILLSGFVVRLIGRKDDEYYQFGYGSFEPFYIVMRTIVLLSMNGTLLYEAVTSLMNGGREVDASLALLFTFISIVGCTAVYIILRREAKALNSPLLKAESRSWLNDILISVSVLISFGIMALLKSSGHQQIAMYIDPLITIIFVIFLAPPLVKQMVYAIKDLLDAAPPQEVQDRLERIVEGYAEKCGFKDYLIYSSKRGRTVTAMIHIILSEDLPVSRLDGIRKQILCDIHSSWQWSDTDIVFTLDPSWMEYAVPSASSEGLIG